jgi:hypothetical protein
VPSIRAPMKGNGYPACSQPHGGVRALPYKRVSDEFHHLAQRGRRNSVYSRLCRGLAQNGAGDVGLRSSGIMYPASTSLRGMMLFLGPMGDLMLPPPWALSALLGQWRMEPLELPRSAASSGWNASAER